MQDRTTTVRSREPGEGLRRVMANAGLNALQVAALDWSKSRIYRLLNGKRGWHEPDVALFLGACHAKSADRDRRWTSATRSTNPAGSNNLVHVCRFRCAR